MKGRLVMLAWVFLLSLCSLSFLGCNPRGRAVTNATDSTPDFKNATQFVNISSAGPGFLWVVTLRGELIRISPEGQNKATNTGQVTAVSFVDATNGWLVDRENQVLRTRNGGSSWHVLSKLTRDGDGFYVPRQLLFIDSTNGWLIDVYTIWHTTDGGETWGDRFSMSTAPEDKVWQSHRASFVDASNGWLASTNGFVHRTTNGGKTWETRMVGSERADFHDIQFIDDNVGWMVGRPDGGVFFTEDGGETWQKQLANDERTYLNSAYFVNKDEGWAVGWRVIGDKNQDREGVVLHTLDGGRNWLTVSVGQKERFFDRVLFSDVKHGWLIARDNVYLTNNGGQTWEIAVKLEPIKENTQ